MAHPFSHSPTLPFLFLGVRVALNFKSKFLRPTGRTARRTPLICLMGEVTGMYEAGTLLLATQNYALVRSVWLLSPCPPPRGHRMVVVVVVVVLLLLLLVPFPSTLLSLLSPFAVA